MWTQLAISITQGDGYIYAMIALAWIGLMILIERSVMLQFVYHIDFNKFLSNIRKMINAEDIDRAVTLCKKVSRTSLPRISLRALEAAETDPSTVKGTIEEETIDFLPKLESRLGFIPALATLVLLVGVLGTIDALWDAFHSIDVLDTSEKQASLANGIAKSLTHSAMGLIVCMVLLTGHQLLKGIAVKLAERIHYGVAVLTNLLAPQDAVAYMPVAGEMPMMDTHSSPAQDDFVASSNEVEEDEDDSEQFDDASVEDIKDEEEII